MPDSPDIDRLLRRPRVGKPHEEFVLPPPPAEPTPQTVAPSITPEAVLRDEADHVQELLDLIIQHAEDVSVPVPPELQGLLGPVVTTRDYLGNLTTRGGKAHRLREHFEQHALPGCGLGTVFPVFLAPGLQYFLDTLLSAANVTQGILVTGSVGTSGLPHWGQDVSQALGGYHQALLSDSRSFRGAAARAVFSMQTDLRSQLLRCLFQPSVDSPLEEVRSALQQLQQVLQLLRTLLCYAQFLQLMKLQNARGLFKSLLEEQVLNQLLQLVAVLVNQAKLQVAAPVLDLLTEGEGGCDPLDLVGDAVGGAVITAIGEASAWLTGYYNKLAADLLRKLHKQNRVLLEGVGLLTRQSMIGRWIQHLDQAILLVNQLLAATDAGAIQGTLSSFLNRALPAPNSRLLQALGAHPSYRHLQDDTHLFPGGPRTT